MKEKLELLDRNSINVSKSPRLDRFQDFHWNVNILIVIKLIIITFQDFDSRPAYVASLWVDLNSFSNDISTTLEWTLITFALAVVGEGFDEQSPGVDGVHVASNALVLGIERADKFPIIRVARCSCLQQHTCARQETFHYLEKIILLKHFLMLVKKTFGNVVII